MTAAGEGVARSDGKVIFVPGALPGERVRVEIVRRGAKFDRARVVEVLEPEGRQRHALPSRSCRRVRRMLAAARDARSPGRGEARDRARTRSSASRASGRRSCARRGLRAPSSATATTRGSASIAKARAHLRRARGRGGRIAPAGPGAPSRSTTLRGPRSAARRAPRGARRPRRRRRARWSSGSAPDGRATRRSCTGRPRCPAALDPTRIDAAIMLDGREPARARTRGAPWIHDVVLGSEVPDLGAFVLPGEHGRAPRVSRASCATSRGGGALARAARSLRRRRAVHDDGARGAPVVLAVEIDAASRPTTSGTTRRDPLRSVASANEPVGGRRCATSALAATSSTSP